MKKTKKVILALAMSTILAGSYLSAACPVWADNIPTLRYDKEKYEIKTSGDYSYIVVNNEAYITSFNSTASYVTIPDTLDGYPVTRIASGDIGAFQNNSSMQTVIIPSSVKQIDSYAFRNCSGLQQVLISDGVKTIGKCAFENCSYMQQVQIKGESLKKIGEYAFNGCIALDNFTIPNSVTEIGNKAFNACSSLSSITIPDSVVTMGGGVFTNCSSLADAVIGNSVTKLVSFGSDTGGTDGWKDGTFENCTSLARITIGSGVTTIEADTFCNTALEEILIPDNVETIGQGAFANCNRLLTATIGNGTKTMGNQVFYKCPSLETVTIGNNVRSIGKMAFHSDSSLTEITIPSSVTSLGGGSFAGCTSLEKAVIGNGVPKLGSDGSDYNGTDSWKDGMFENCSSLTELKLGDGIITIGTDAFYNTKLTHVVIPDNVVTIQKGAFANCVSLEAVTIGSGVTSIGDYAFQENAALKTITIGNGVVSIGRRALAKCTSLENLLIPSGVTSLGGGICAGCSSLTNVIIGNGVLSLDTDGSDCNGYSKWNDGAFEDCTSLTDIALGNGFTHIGTDTFTNTKLTSLLIPSKVSTIDDAMAYNTGIRHIYFTGAAPTIGKEIYGTAETTLYYIAEKTGYNNFENYSFETFSPITVSFDLNSAEVFAIQPNNQLLSPEGGYVIEPITPMSEGYLFLGWYSDSSCTDKWNFLEDKVTADTTLYAKWIATDKTIPAAPNAPQVEEARHNSVTIKWDSVIGAESYNIYLNGKLITETPVKETSYTITGLNPDSWYEVYITACNSAGISQPGLIRVIETSAAPENPDNSDDNNNDNNTSSYIKGDVNEDGKVTLADAQLALKAALKITTLKDTAALAADVTGNDGQITLADAQLILKVALKITTF